MASATTSWSSSASSSAWSFPPGATHQQILNKLVAELRGGHNERNRAAKELHAFVCTDLREAPAEQLNVFLDALTKRILDLVKASDPAAKLGGVLAIVALINADVCNTNDRVSRFGNYLRNNCLPPNTADVAVIELAARAIARLTQVSGTTSTTNVKFELIDHEMKRALELLSGTASERASEGKQYAAVLVLREIAFSMPTFFFQKIGNFFEVIFNAMWDQQPLLRVAAVNALRAGLLVKAQRETSKAAKKSASKDQTTCFDISFEQAMSGIDVPAAKLQDRKFNRDDYAHGGVLILGELLRAANSAWERAYRDIQDSILSEENMGAGWPGLGIPSPGTATAAIGVGPPPPPQAHGAAGGAGAAGGGRSSTGGSLAAVRRYYQAGFRNRASSLSTSTSAATGAMVSVSSLIPFHWCGTVMYDREPVVESAQCRALIMDKYDKVCRDVLAVAERTGTSSKGNLFLQYALMFTLPKLAALDRERFCRSHLSMAMRYMDRLLAEKNRHAFVAIGLLAVAVGSPIQSLLPNTLAHVRQALPPRDGTISRKKGHPTRTDPAVFACISLLARAVRASIHNEVADMLDPMLGAGLTPALTTALHELAFNIPTFRGEIAEGLLRILSLILMQQTFAHPGTPKKLLSPSQLGQALSGNSSLPPEPPETFAVVLGLKTLGTFDFESHSLLRFVRYCADHYLQSEEKPVRLEAVKTCASLLKASLLTPSKGHSQTVTSTINDVLAKLLIVGITDQDADVRACVMDCFGDDCFDLHLAQAENLSSLFISLNDEVLEIREQSVCIIGRLSQLNPAYIFPSLRKTLMELLNEMELSGVGRNKEQSARMLGHLVANAPSLIRPYVEPILKVLVPKLREQDLNPMVITSVLRAVGDLAHVGGSAMTEHGDELMPLLLDILGDGSSSQKREVTLWALSQLVESTGCVIEPYQRFPSLLETLLGFLRTEQQGTIRAQTLRLIGLLGALDPYRHKLITGQVDSAGVTSAPLIPIGDINELEQSWEMSPSELLVNMGSNNSLEEFYPSVAISILMKIVRDPMLSQHHTEVIQAVTYIFMALGIKSIPYIAQVSGLHICKRTLIVLSILGNRNNITYYHVVTSLPRCSRA
jgi:FKBP12-rapamycin complex-associated protein